MATKRHLTKILNQANLGTLSLGTQISSSTHAEPLKKRSETITLPTA